MDHLFNSIPFIGGSAGMITSVWNVITTRNNKEMIEKQEVKIDSIQKALSEHQTEVAKEYVTKASLQNMQAQINSIHNHLLGQK